MVCRCSLRPRAQGATGDAHSGLVHQSLIRVPLEKGSLLKPFSKISALVPDQIHSLNSTRWQKRALGAEPAPQRVARMLERCLKSSLLLVSPGSGFICALLNSTEWGGCLRQCLLDQKAPPPFFQHKLWLCFVCSGCFSLLPSPVLNSLRPSSNTISSGKPPSVFPGKMNLSTVLSYPSVALDQLPGPHLPPTQTAGHRGRCPGRHAVTARPSPARHRPQSCPQCTLVFTGYWNTV